MDGSKALIYARSRETSSDFARSARQRALLVALKAKVANLGTLSNPVKITQLMSAFGNNVQTDLSLSNASRLYGIIKGVDDTNVKSVSLAEQGSSLVTTGNINGQSVVLPKAGLFQYGAIQDFIKAQLKDPYIMKENAKILILNGTAISDVAKTKADELKVYGYNITETGNMPSTDWTQTTLVDLTHHNKYTKNYLEKRLGTKAANSLSDKTIETNGADFVIIIGSNEASSTQSQAH
jgi:anionic cell wall polymer biosynthesis LytR-Cps2A-Psr (LCP) family protein